MKNPARVIVGCVLSLSVIIASAGLEFAKAKSLGRKPEKMRTSAVAKAMLPAALSSLPQAPETPSVGRSIVVLQTRDYRVTIFSGQQEPRYSIATDHGIALADNLSASDLQGRFPELHEIIMGIAWAGVSRIEPLSFDKLR